MCAICGCSGTVDAGHVSDEDAHQHQPGHGHEPGPEHEHEHVHADGSVTRHRHSHSLLTRRTIEVERDLLADNDAVAADNRRQFAAMRTLVLNLMSSPGSGKTTLLEQTLLRLRRDVPMPVAVIEGDQQTSLDAERIRKTGVPAVQVNTGKACHLDALMVKRALTELPPLRDGLLLIENVGNLVCPAGFDLGEQRRVVIASVTEGEDKPLKYPGMFAHADLVVVSKIDLLPYLDFDGDRFARYAEQVRPGVELLWLSARTGDGMAAWLAWLRQQRSSLG